MFDSKIIFEKKKTSKTKMFDRESPKKIFVELAMHSHDIVYIISYILTWRRYFLGIRHSRT